MQQIQVHLHNCELKLSHTFCICPEVQVGLSSENKFIFQEGMVLVVLFCFSVAKEL